MKGILLVSHGKMAEGLADTISMILGSEPEKFDFLSLTDELGAEEFRELMDKKLKELNSGDGVVVFTDLFGGTPSNTSVLFAGNSIDIISGMNLPMLLQYVLSRNNEFDAEGIVETAKEGIVHVNSFLNKLGNANED